MDPEMQQFLSLQHLPARLNVDQAGWLLGFNTHEIPKLTKAKLLQPLGHPGPTATKVYSMVKLRRLRENEVWLNKASDAMYSYWQRRNQQAKKRKKV